MTGAVRPTGWRAEQRVGTAAELHHAWPAVERDPTRRAVATCRPTRPAVVLGSTQPESLVDLRRAEDAGVDVVRRRSGGGAVLVAPGDPLWLDVWVPAGDPLAEDDVSRAFSWIGATWAEALIRIGGRGLSVSHGPMARRAGAAGQACFGAVSSGEVAAADGRKVVGLAQRRVRAGSWFHGACPGMWDPAPLIDLLSLEEGERAPAISELASAAVGVAELLGREADVSAALSDASAAFTDALP